MSTATQPQQVTDRDQWLNARKQAIGASDLPAILGLSPFAGPWEVWAEKTNQLNPWKGDDSTRAGQFFERSVLDAAESELGPLRRNVRIAHPKYPIAATLDAQVIATSNPVEAKTTGIVGPVYGTWGDAMTDQVPDYYLVQVHAQLMCTESELAYLFALIAGRGVVQFQVHRSDSLHARLGELASEWWDNHVVKGIEPSHEMLPPLDVVKRLKRVANKSTVFGPAATKVVERRQRLNQAKLDIEKRLKQADAAVLLALGDAESATLANGAELTYFETKRDGYSVEPTSYRTLRVKGAK